MNDLYDAFDYKCYRLTFNDDGNGVLCREFPAIRSDNEEANTGVFLHVLLAASEGTREIVIKSRDTYVAVIGVVLTDQISAQVL